jgi:hypothetical protein
VVSAIARATEWQATAPRGMTSRDALYTLEKSVETELGPRWVRIRQQFQHAVGALDIRWDSLVLLYAHLLRLPVEDPALQKRAPPEKLTREVSYLLNFTSQVKRMFSCRPLLSSMRSLVSRPHAVGLSPRSQLCVCMRTWRKGSYLAHQAHDGPSCLASTTMKSVPFHPPAILRRSLLS